ISRFSAFQDLVHVNSRAPIQVIVVYPIGHEAALINNLFAKSDSNRQLDCARSFACAIALCNTSGLTGIRSTFTFRSASASSIPRAIAVEDGMVPPSPAPLHPSESRGVGVSIGSPAIA